MIRTIVTFSRVDKQFHRVTWQYVIIFLVSVPCVPCYNFLLSFSFNQCNYCSQIKSCQKLNTCKDKLMTFTNNGKLHDHTCIFNFHYLQNLNPLFFCTSINSCRLSTLQDERHTLTKKE